MLRHFFRTSKKRFDEVKRLNDKQAASSLIVNSVKTSIQNEPAVSHVFISKKRDFDA
jgi:hypothetical protein